ncbi:phage tail sheath family protein [Shewanella halifaxensis]|uniref:phage tail sheath family protein n=1 Tax=Shewanella halifaxensis TaxID=271098 RepID=UPI000D58F2DF|nr:phage tail sheath family protein [Shewanella halifaxensis]
MKHGVNTVEVLSGPVPVLEVASAIVGIFGTSEIAAAGTIIKTLNYDEAKEKLGAGSLLDSIRRIHLFSPNATVISYVLGKNADFANPSPAGKSKTKVAEAVEDAVGGSDDTPLSIAARASEADPLLAAFIARLPLIRTTQAKFGFMPKIWLAPNILHRPGAAALAASAISKARGTWIAEPPAGSTEEEAKAFKDAISNQRVQVLYPRPIVVKEDGSTDLDWGAPSYAGLIVQMDKNMTGETMETGYWCSPSNFVMPDVVGTEFDFEYFPNDPDCAVNQLNAQGLVTFINFNGIRVFGNRNSSYPAKSDVMTFISWRRTMDVIEESIEQFTMQFLDRPMFTSPNDVANTLIGRIAESVDDYLRSMIGTSIVYGECLIKVEDNPLSNMMQGKIKFAYKATPAMAMESVEYEAEIYVKGLEDALSQLLGGN